jgi:serine/threonine protein kinase
MIPLNGNEPQQRDSALSGVRTRVYAESVSESPSMATAPIQQLGGAERIGKYEILSEIGRGGMSAVYRARMVGPGQASKTVALKLFDPALSVDRDLPLMFLDEMRITMSMTHRNIVQTFDAGEQGDLLYLVMELVQGCSLRALLDSAPNQPLPLDIVAFIAMEVAAALDYAHNHQPAPNEQRGVIHRDISPSNILLSTEGDVRLADFGVAKAAGRLSITVIDAIKGKLAYMSPEQARGQALAASDLFSLGAVVYEAITGRSIRQTVTLDAVRDYAGPTLPLPLAHGENASQLAALTHSCLSARPHQRPESAMALRRLLQQTHARLAPPEEPDPHARLKHYLHQQMCWPVTPEASAPAETAHQGNPAAQQLAGAIRARVGQLPEDASLIQVYQSARASDQERDDPTVPMSSDAAARRDPRIEPTVPHSSKPDQRPERTVPHSSKPDQRPELQLRRGARTAPIAHPEFEASIVTADIPYPELPQRRRRLWLPLMLLAGLGTPLGLWLSGSDQTADDGASAAQDRSSSRGPGQVDTPPTGVTSDDSPAGSGLGAAESRERAARARSTSLRARQRRRAQLRRTKRRQAVALAAKRDAAKQQASTQRPGHLYLNSRPWTSVTVDGVYRGETPIEGLKLEPGQHRVRLVNRKLSISRTLSIRIEAGKDLRKAIVFR